MATTKANNLLAIGGVYLWTTFIFRTADLLGSDYAGKRPPYEGQVLTVVGFQPRLVNNVIVCDPKGNLSLMPSWLVELALKLQAPYAHGEQKNPHNGREQVR
jgi:hypothetical protein